MPIVDKWSGFAELMANLIAKYALDLSIKNLPDPIEEKAVDKEANIDEISVDDRMSA